MSDRRGSIFLRAAAAFFQRIMTAPLATSAAFRTTTYSNLKVEFINSVSISDLTKIWCCHLAVTSHALNLFGYARDGWKSEFLVWRRQTRGYQAHHIPLNEPITARFQIFTACRKYVLYSAYIYQGLHLRSSRCKSQAYSKAPAQKNNEDYESILSNLANDIRKRQLKLSEIRLRERRSTLLTTLYTLGAWVAYVSVWYFDSLPSVKTSSFGVAKRMKVVPVIFGPVVYVYPSFLSSFT